jgi:hypothetical protein
MYMFVYEHEVIICPNVDLEIFMLVHSLSNDKMHRKIFSILSVKIGIYHCHIFLSEMMLNRTPIFLN